MKELILLKAGELALKGLNRSSFEDKLMKNARQKLQSLGSFEMNKAQSTIYIRPTAENTDMAEALERMLTLFGAAGVTRCAACEKDFGAICKTAAEYLGPELDTAFTFKVEAKRSDKSFPMKSPEICRELGAYLLDIFPHLTVDLENPGVLVVVEVRDFGAYIHSRQLPGAGGLPVGTSGRAALLLSGGIDSPVAGHMMAKRGMQIIAVHFMSPPYTSDRSLHKVVTLAKEMSRYTGAIPLFAVPFTTLQEQIKEYCPEEYNTLVMRRLMMRIACIIAERQNCQALITGESIAQVASQTVQSIACTDRASTLPVLRPVIGLDKLEIVDIARKIGTFETSILPYEDCCTVFTPRHPKTRPRLPDVERAENLLPDLDVQLQRAADETRWLLCHEYTPLDIPADLWRAGDD